MFAQSLRPGVGKVSIAIINDFESDLERYRDETGEQYPIDPKDLEDYVILKDESDVLGYKDIIDLANILRTLMRWL